MGDFARGTGARSLHAIVAVRVIRRSTKSERLHFVDKY
jgi:hypothetical protein